MDEIDETEQQREAAMEIIAKAGAAKSCAFAAIHRAKTFDFVGAAEQLDEAERYATDPCESTPYISHIQFLFLFPEFPVVFFQFLFYFNLFFCLFFLLIPCFRKDHIKHYCNNSCKDNR